MEEPCLREGKRVLDQCRSSVQLKPIEKLGRCRVLFHHISELHKDKTEALQGQIFGLSSKDLPEREVHGDFLKEYHMHALLSDNGSCFSLPTKENCISDMNNTCSFEMHETVERVYEKTAASSNRESLLKLPNDVVSGPVSMASIRRISVTSDESNAGKMHVEVLSLTGPSCITRSCKTWCSPIIYCKYSINVLVVDPKALLMKGSPQQAQLSSVLCEIDNYSQSFSSAAEHSLTVTRKALLVVDVDNFPASLRQEISNAVLCQLQAYSSLLIKADDGYPFVFSSDIEKIRNVLLKELGFISKNAGISSQNHIYTHAAVMLSQELSKEPMDVVDLHTLIQRLRELVSNSDSEPAKLKMVEEGTLHYLQNTGLAYIPGESAYATLIISRAKMKILNFVHDVSCDRIWATLLSLVT